jgi:hypothetical protein
MVETFDKLLLVSVATPKHVEKINRQTQVAAG